MTTWLLIAVAVASLAGMEIWLHKSRREVDRQQEYMWDATQSKIRERLSDPIRLESIMAVRERLGAQQVFLDNVCRMAAVSLHAPKSVMTMLDGETQSWIAHHFESEEGANPPNEHTFTETYCQFAVASDRTLAIENAKRDVLVKDNPCTTLLGMRAYLGSPVHSVEGFPIGSLCVFDYKRRHWNRRDVATIESLAALVTL